MKELSVISGNQTLKGEKIRYIEFKRNKYFIYTLNEKDAEGYEKLYINKIVENEEDLITELEWEELKRNIPTFVKEIKSNKIVSFTDLNINDIVKGNLNYAKAFKLKVSIVDTIKKIEKKEEKVDIRSEINNLLSELNSQEKSINGLDSFLDKVDEQNIGMPINPNNKKDLEIEDLKEQLEGQKQENKELQNKIVDLQLQIDKYKSKLEQIKIMINQS